MFPFDPLTIKESLAWLVYHGNDVLMDVLLFILTRASFGV